VKAEEEEDDKEEGIGILIKSKWKIMYVDL
jgi:hypothetical protein